MLKNLFQILLTLEIAYLLSAMKDEDLVYLNQHSFSWLSQFLFEFPKSQHCISNKKLTLLQMLFY